MNTILKIWQASLLSQVLDRLCAAIGRQWKSSRIVHWFLHPRRGGEALSQGSILCRAGAFCASLLSRLYAALRLEKIVEGSIFLHPVFWCALPMILAPLLPTMAVLVLVLAAYCSVVLTLLHKRTERLVYSSINKYLLLYLLIYLLAALLSVNFRGSLQPAMLSILFSLFPLALENCRPDSRMLMRLTSAIVVSGTVVALIGIGQYFLGITGAAAWLDSNMFSDISTRVYSTLQNPNVLAEYLLLVIPLAVALFLHLRERRHKLFFLGCCAILGLCMILTFSRGGWLGLLIAAAVFVLLWKPKLMLLAPLALAVLYFVMPESVISRIASVGNLKDSSTSYRVSIWMGSLAMLKDGYWLCGVGPGTAAFNQVYPAYSYSAANAQHAHNLYLQMTTEGGVMLLGSFVCVIFVLFRRICVRLQSAFRDGRHLYLIAVLSGLTGFLAQGMTDYSFYNYRVVLMFWAVVGLGAAWLRDMEKGDPR